MRIEQRVLGSTFNQCEYYPQRKTSCCNRPVVARFVSVKRGPLWLCAPHVKRQDERDKAYLAVEHDRTWADLMLHDPFIQQAIVDTA